MARPSGRSSFQHLGSPRTDCCSCRGCPGFISGSSFPSRKSGLFYSSQKKAGSKRTKVGSSILCSSRQKKAGSNEHKSCIIPYEQRRPTDNAPTSLLKLIEPRAKKKYKERNMVLVVPTAVLKLVLYVALIRRVARLLHQNPINKNNQNMYIPTRTGTRFVRTTAAVQDYVLICTYTYF